MANQELLDYIKQETTKGTPKETMKSDLLAQGWQSADIEESIATANAEVSPTGNVPGVESEESAPSTGTVIALSVCGLIIAVGAGYFAAQMLLSTELLSNVTNEIVDESPDITEADTSASDSVTPTTPTSTPTPDPTPDPVSTPDPAEEPVEENQAISFVNNLSSCTPAEYIYAVEESTGRELREEVLGMVNGLCEYVIDLDQAEPEEMKCRMTASERQVIAQYYEDFITDNISDTSLYIINGKEVENVFTEAKATGICETV